MHNGGESCSITQLGCGGVSEWFRASSRCKVNGDQRSYSAVQVVVTVIIGLAVKAPSRSPVLTRVSDARAHVCPARFTTFCISPHSQPTAVPAIPLPKWDRCTLPSLIPSFNSAPVPDDSLVHHVCRTFVLGAAWFLRGSRHRQAVARFFVSEQSNPRNLPLSNIRCQNKRWVSTFGAQCRSLGGLLDGPKLS